MVSTKVPSYRLYKRTGDGVVSLNGKDFYLGKHDTTESLALYEETIRRWEAAGFSLNFEPPARPQKPPTQISKPAPKKRGRPPAGTVREPLKPRERKDPSYRLHKPSGRAVVTLSGKEIPLGQYGSKESHERYIAELEKWKARGRTAESESSVTTLAEIAELFMRDALEINGEGTEYNHNCRCLLPLINLYPNMSTLDFEVEHFERCVTWWLRGGKWLDEADAARLRAGDLAPSRPKAGEPLPLTVSKSYVTKMLSYLRTFLRWARKHKFITADVLVDINERRGDVTKRVRKCEELHKAPKVKAYDDTKINQICKALSPVVADMVRLHRIIGGRPDEICRIKPSMVDRSNADCWVIRYDEHKNAWREQDRFIPVNQDAQKILGKYINNRDPDDYCFKPAEAVRHMVESRRASRKTPLSCGNRAGTNRREKPKTKPRERYDHCTYGRAIKRVCEKLFPVPEHLTAEGRERDLMFWKKANWLSPNQLRHSCGTGLAKDHGLEGAAAVLGHKDTKTTQIYVTPDNSLAIEVAKKSSKARK